MKTLVTSGAALVLAIATIAAQEPQQPAPFRTAVDLVPVDVNVLDKDGRPITGLGVDDFTLSVDGRPRRLVSAQYISTSRAPQAPSATPAFYSSNSTASGGRMIMLVVDQGNIGTGRGRTVMESAQRFLAQLSPADRVGLATIPGTGPQVDFTANHAAVSSLLLRVYGQASPPPLTHDMGLSEALRIERGDRLILQEVLNRSCAGVREPAQVSMCQQQVISDAKSLHSVARERTLNSIIALRSLMDRLELTLSPKTLIYISEGLVIDREISELTWLAPAAARAQVVIYALQLEAPMFDASVARPSPSAGDDRSLNEEGLGALAGLTRGTAIRVSTSADFAFRRLGLELSAYYLLSFEPEASDRDGNSHKIAVAIPNRKDVTIRARREFIVGNTRTKSAEEILTETMRAPLQASDIGLKVATYTLRDPDSARLRILISADIDRSSNATDTMALAYALIDSSGKVVASELQPSLPRPPAGGVRGQAYVGNAMTEMPGVHTLKLAVVDGRGRRGSVEHTFRAQLFSAGQVRVTDLLVAESSTRQDGAVIPAVAGEFTTGLLHTYLELYSEPAVLESAKVVVEVAADEQSRTLDSAEARVQGVQGERTRRTAEAAVPIALLPPGDYVVRAIVNVDGRKAGQLTRPFTIAKAVTTPAASAEGNRSGMASRPPIPFSSRIDQFDRAAVLTPPVVGFFIDRLNFGPGGNPTIGPALDHARAGRFDAAADALGTGDDQQLAGVFLKGLALYAKGDLEGAAAKFRESLRIDSEFFTAAFYLGSCYAAGRKDREAVGAWQTSLVTESDAPFIYTLLSDALLRLRDVNGALDILNEAKGLWPDSDEVQLRLGTALALAGRMDEALKVLDPYLARNPEDHERHFIVLQAIYQARLAGKSIRSPAEDRALFERYAAAYVAAKGPQQAMVDTWRKFIERERR